MTVTLVRFGAVIAEGCAQAAHEGALEGRRAAGWVTDGNTTRETYLALRTGIEDGDPAVLNELPSNPLDGTTATDVAMTALDEGGYSRDLIEETWGDDAWIVARDEITDAYEAAWSQAVRDEVLRACNYQLEESNA